MVGNGEQGTRSASSKGSRRTTPLALVVALAAGATLAVAQGQVGTPTAEQLIEQARTRELEQLRLRVGRFTSGEVPVYAGTLRAASAGRGAGIVKLPQSRVIAFIEERESLGARPGGGVALTIVSSEHELWLELSQSTADPGTTHCTRVRPVRASAGLTGSCSGCLADLATRPEVLELYALVATGRVRGPFGPELRVTVNGRLERLPASRLRLEDLEPLNPGFQAFLDDEATPFERRGREGIRLVARALEQEAPVPARTPPEARCDRITHYSAERFVNLDELGQFGVRQLKILGAEVCCIDHEVHGQGPECVPEEPR